MDPLSYFYHPQTDSLWKLGPITISIVRSIQQYPPYTIQAKNQINVLQLNPLIRCLNEFLINGNTFICLTNLRLRLIENKQFGLSISNSTECFEMYGKPKTIVQWYDYMKYYCIQFEFRRNYEIQELVGEGSQACVYKIRNVNTNAFYAAKVFIKAKLPNVKTGQKAIAKEIEILRQLDHDCIIHMHEVYEDNLKVYLVLDLLEGKELFEELKLQKTIYNESLVKQLMTPLFKAVEYLHKKNIMHRDLKPENLILKRKNDITSLVIVDFGLSDMYNKENEYLFNRCGTIGYVAPEILNELPYDHKVDIFSLGIILFILLTGDSPFQGYDTEQILDYNYNCTIDFNKLNQQSPAVVELAQLLLSNQPEERLTATQALNHSWFQGQAISSNKQISITSIDFCKTPTLKIHQNHQILSKAGLLKQNRVSKDYGLQGSTLCDNLEGEILNFGENEEINSPALKIDRYQLYTQKSKQLTHYNSP